MVGRFICPYAMVFFKKHSFSVHFCSQAGLQPHHRGGIWVESGECGGQNSEAPDLGHSRPGAVSVRDGTHLELLTPESRACGWG